MNCTDCPLHQFAKTNCFPAKIGSDPRIAIYMDFPNRDDDASGRLASRPSRLVLWMLRRMTVSLDNVVIAFTLKCHKPKKQLTHKADRLEAIEQCRGHQQDILDLPNLKAYVIMGGISCEAFFNGEQLKTREGAHWRPYKPYSEQVDKIFVAYSPGYAIESPSETPRIYRMIWSAAKYAGLHPIFNPNIKPFEYDS